MKKSYRIRKNEEFSRIINKKHSIGSACFVVYYSEKAENNCRVGISVSKKMGNAVDRNKIKRQVRSMAMSLINFDECQKDIIIIVRNAYLKNTYKDNIFDLEKMLKKAII